MIARLRRSKAFAISNITGYDVSPATQSQYDPNLAEQSSCEVPRSLATRARQSPDLKGFGHVVWTL